MKKLLIISSVILLIIAAIFISGQYFGKIYGGGTGNYNIKTKQFKQEDEGKTISRMVSLKKGIYYYGFSECPWCQELLPIYNDVLLEQKKKSYVVNTKDTKLSKHDRKKLSKFYQRYTGDKRLTVPFIVVIKASGQVSTHVGTVTNHDAKKRKLTAKQKLKLKETLQKLIK